MSGKYFRVGSNLCLIGFEYFKKKTLHVEGNKIPKDVHAGPFGFSSLILYVRAMSGTNIREVTK